MAYQFADGFDNYGNAFVMVAGYPWDVAAGGNEVTSTADFRFTPPGSLPGGCVSMTGSGNILRKNMSGNIVTLIVGVGFKLLTLPAASTEIIGFWDNGTEQCSLVVNSLGALQFFRGNGVGTPIGTPSANGTVVANAWNGVAVQVTFNGTTGAVQAYLNGAVSALFNSTGLNNITTANAYANQVSLGGNVASSPTIRYDDFYCFDTTGAAPNALLGGDARVLTKMSSGAGTYTNWTPTGFAANWQNASSTPPNIADFNANNTATTKDSYTTQVAGLGVAPYFVTVRASLTRDDAGPHTPSLFVRSGASDSAGIVTPALTSSYVFYDAVIQNDPATGSPWTASGADNAQVGIIEG